MFATCSRFNIHTEGVRNGREDEEVFQARTHILEGEPRRVPLDPWERFGEQHD